MTHKQLIRALDYLVASAVVTGTSATAVVLSVWHQATEKLLVSLAFLVLASALTKKFLDEVVSGIKR